MRPHRLLRVALFAAVLAAGLVGPAAFAAEQTAGPAVANLITDDDQENRNNPRRNDDEKPDGRDARNDKPEDKNDKPDGKDDKPDGKDDKNDKPRTGDVSVHPLRLGGYRPPAEFEARLAGASPAPAVVR
jgi:hypothetical protein